MTELLKLLRPKHWVKNVLIFAPLIFGGDVFLIGNWMMGLRLFVAFSALASCIYVLNDWVDRKRDKLHFEKKHRPLASGKVSGSRAACLAVGLLALVVALAVNFSMKTIVVLFVYLVANLLYSFRLKHVVLVDIFLVAGMYLLRIFAGGKLWNIDLSHWIILCTFFLALFLISAKRRAEFNEHGGTKAKTRKVMNAYNLAFLDSLLTISTTSSLVAYSLYVVSVGKPYFLYSIFFVAFGLIRYLYLVYKEDLGQAPEQVILTDKWILFTGACWLSFSGVIFYMF